jgi:signal peptide peptidase SppA
MDEFVYDAFISYSHRDMKWARWLQRRLETFRIPKDLCGGNAPRGHLKVFRDQTDLSGVELQNALQRELEASRFLIVICSPFSAASPWVNDEIRSFQTRGRSKFIIPFIVDGEPESDKPELECFPPALRSVEGEHPLGASAVELGKNKAFLKLMAVILDVRFNRLVDREKQRKRRTVLLSSAVTAVIIAVLASLLWRNAVIRKQNQEMVDSIWQSICEDIAVSRNIDVETLKSYAANLAVSFPEEALAAGMIDAVDHEDYLFTLYDNYGVKRNDNGLFNTTTLADYVSSINTSHLSTSAGNSKSLEFETAPIVAIIYAEGQIVDGNNYEDGSVYGSRLARELRDARLNDAIKSVVVRVNSPGGSAIASELAWREMTLLQQVKPVVISMGDMAASGGYYISAPADYIFSDKSTLTGSIGVFGMIPNAKNFLTYRLGITFDGVQTSKAAVTPNIFQPVTDIQRKNLTKGVDRVYETFTQHVAEGRNLDINRVLEIAEGRVWSGTMAKEIGLVDAIGGFNEAVGKAVELADISSNYKICEYVAPLTPFEEYLNSMTATYTKSLGLDYNIYGDEMREIIKEIPMVFTHSGIQTRVVGDLKIEF